MKKLILLLALLSLVLLCFGCKSEDPAAETTAVTTEATVPGIYLPESNIETQTAGAVRAYSLEDNFSWANLVGDQLLLATAGDAAGLSVLTGLDCVKSASVDLDIKHLESGYATLQSGFAYYIAEENTAVFLDSQLHEINRVKLPQDIQGEPVFSPDGSEIFYCVGQEIRGFEVQRKISRLIKSHTCKSQILLGCYFDGKLLSCRTEDEQGNTNTVYVSTETGETEKIDNALEDLHTFEDRYFAVRKEGVVTQRIIGTKGGEFLQLNIAQQKVASALELGGVLGYEMPAENALLVSFYDVTTGLKTADIQIPGVFEPQDFLADRWSNCIWITAKEQSTQKNILLRWDISKSAVSEDVVYTDVLYTADLPDEAGLKSCKDRVNQLNKTYGVSIHIWDDAVKTPGEYKLVAEHQPVAINGVLDSLEPVLKQFPKNFLLKSANTKIRICIVRSVNGEPNAVHFWNKGDAFILLSPGVNVADGFIKAFGYVVNSHVLGNSTLLDGWNALNPENFIYGETASEAYLNGDQRAFIDEESMGSVTEDRSRIFWQAMLPDNAQMFKSEIMQKKLLLLCQGIRDAWRLQWKEETYPWEQYLSESIAYKK